MTIIDLLNKKRNTFPLIEGLVSYYKLDEISGTTAFDAYGSDNLTITGLTKGAAGKIGTSLQNTAAGQYARSTSATAITGDFTINTWVYITGVNSGTYNAIIQQGTDVNGFGLWLRTSDNALYYMYNNYGATGSIIPLNQWVMLSETLTGSTLKVYLNGGQVYTASKTTTATTSTNRMLFTRDNLTNQMKGSQDESGFWNRGLSAGEITTLYNSGNGITL